MNAYFIAIITFKAGSVISWVGNGISLSLKLISNL